MGEYIDRKLFKEQFWDACRNCLSEDDIADLIDSAPSADVALVVHSKWIYRTRTVLQFFEDEWLECSNCKSLNGTMIKFNYCPNCGAKMDGKETNHDR